MCYKCGFNKKGKEKILETYGTEKESVMRKNLDVKRQENQKKKGKKSRQIVLILIFVLLLLMLFGLRSCNKDEPNIPKPNPNLVDRDIAENAQKVKSPEYEKYEKGLNEQSQQASIRYNPSPIFGGDNETGLLVWYPNIGDADYIMVDIYAPDSDELIYSSPLIPKDSAITVDRLDKEMPVGTYACKVITTAVEEQNGQKIAKPNKPVTKINIIIAE